MMAEIKKGLKLIRYGYGLKTNLSMGILFLIVGILMLGCDGTYPMLGIIYILLAPTMLIQLESTLLYSGMTAASSKRRLLEIVLPEFLTIIIGVLGCVAVVGVGWFWADVRQESTDACMEIMLGSGLLVAILLIYFGSAYKYFIVSVILVVIAMIIGMGSGVVIVKLVGEKLNMLTVSMLCIAFIIIGIVISCCLRRVCYRKQISLMAAGMYLRKALQ